MAAGVTVSLPVLKVGIIINYQCGPGLLGATARERPRRYSPYASFTCSSLQLQQRLTGKLGFKLLVQLEVGGGGGGGKCTHNHDALQEQEATLTGSD